jgi:superoxide dismutase
MSLKNTEVIKELNNYISETTYNLRKVIDESIKLDIYKDINFSNENIANSFFVFLNIISNKSLKECFLTQENATRYVSSFLIEIEKTFGFNMDKIIEEIIKEKGEF